MAESGLNAFGLRAARKIVKETASLMKGQSGDYVRGWRAALREADRIMKVRVDAIQLAARKPQED